MENAKNHLRLRNDSVCLLSLLKVETREGHGKGFPHFPSVPKLQSMNCGAEQGK